MRFASRTWGFWLLSWMTAACYESVLVESTGTEIGVGNTDGCVVGQSVYHKGDSFPSDDGCGRCTCGDDGRIACGGPAYYSPGCGLQEWMPRIEPGCYDRCAGAPCMEGVCRVTSIHPCPCRTGLDCCDVCDRWEWLCLDSPSTCVDHPSFPQIESFVNGRPETVAYYRATLLFRAQDNSDCRMVSLRACTRNISETCWYRAGVLTSTGQAKAVGLAAELLGVPLGESLGCEDCAESADCPACEGKATSILYLMFDDEPASISYERDRPPEVLRRADAFAQGLLHSLETCTSTEDVQIRSCGVK